MMSSIKKDQYHDYISDTSLDVLPAPKARSGVTIPFPVRLHQLLMAAEDEGFQQIIGWRPHGRCFSIQHLVGLEAFVFPRLMPQAKTLSFQRQINLYGFKRITLGPDSGCYYHELFLRSKPWLALLIKRESVKAKKGKGIAAPDFYTMKSAFSIDPTAINSNDSPKDCLMSYYFEVILPKSLTITGIQKLSMATQSSEPVYYSDSTFDREIEEALNGWSALECDQVDLDQLFLAEDLLLQQ